MKTLLWIAAGGLVGAAASPAAARADEPIAPQATGSSSPLAPQTTGSSSPIAEPSRSTKRPLPNYDGRGRPRTTAGQVALWIPRTLLSPAYFVTEWLIRRPLKAAISAAERANLPVTLYNFFTFGTDHKAGVLPIAFVDFGFNPSVGAYAFWNDAFFKGDDLRAHVSFWTDDWIGGSVVQRIQFHDKQFVQLKFLGVRRPDHVFYGIGPGSLQSGQSRYAEDRLDFAALVEFPIWRASKLDASAGLRDVSFRDGHYGHDPGIVQSAAAGAFSLPDGFTRGYTAETNDVLLALDSRRPYPSPGSGVRLEAQAEQGSDVRQSPGAGWIHTAAGAGGFWDVTGTRRVLSLSLLMMFSDPLGPRPVPFTELATLGGDIPSPGAFPAPMPGYFPGRLVDRSAAVATLRYKWPIAPWLAGSLQCATGNVFGEHLEGFDTRLLRLSGAFGLESDSSPDSSFELIVGFGTETIEHGAQADSFRLAVGITRF